MDDNKKTLLHLSLISGIGSALVCKILKKIFNDYFSQKNPLLPDLSSVYKFKKNDFVYKLSLSEKIAGLLVDGLADNQLLEKELELIDRYKIKFFTFLDEAYPSGLKQIHLPPIVLYCKGSELPCLEKSLAVVGSRKCSDYAVQVINKIVPEVVRRGYVVISGGALGVDTIAHKSAIQSSGKTVIVLGSGLCNPYPAQNKSFFREVTKKGGTIVSPFPLLTMPQKGNFPARNRIIAGLSIGCLVVQAAKKSGALITAKFALDEGRNVFSVPGSIFDEVSQGCHELLKQGAKPVCSAKDVLEEFGETGFLEEAECANRENEIFLKINNNKVIKEKDEQNPIFKKVLKALEKVSSLEEVFLTIDISMENLQDILFEMELEGLIKQNFSGNWEKI